MKKYPKLNHPPIVEAVVDWNGKIPDDWSLESHKDTITESLKEEFPHYHGKTIQETNVQFTPNAEPQITNTQPITLFAHQFWNKDRTRLIQYRRNGFSFNMLPPYTTFENEIPLMKKEWERYQKLVPGFELQEIRLRYINRIHIPIEAEYLEWDEYFTVGNDSKSIPEGFKSYVNSNQSVWQNLEKHQGILRVLFLENLVPNKEASIMLDTEIAQLNLNSADSDWDRVEAILNELRELKNKSFFGAVTEKCLQMFQ
ncbi:TIGR04255 family protein [Leptospira sp. GIMC2001]|uniref:TIGR04255 family protein n=1 Tax=Leptospira sp. GIMC2001 TaxID=1513297 RepID=UPI00234B096C|nr:TIGR04255 family protein [Leptospira sp. GIMC2001]WCL50753.1 TIGR04255 family protein [Leptospira sp. GIMC2001]